MNINGGNIVAYLDLDMSKYSSNMRLARSQASAFGNDALTVTQKWQGAASAMGTVGNVLTLGITAPTIAFGAASVNSSIQFQSAFAGVEKTVDATTEEFEMLRQSLIAMSEEIPQSKNDLASIMEIAGQLGVGVNDLEKFTRTIADLGVATNLTGQEAATMLAQYANVTGMALNDIDKLGSVIVDLGNNTATTERDIAEFAQRLSGMAATLGLTDAQTLGLSATMAALGLNAEAGGSAMSRTMAKMQQAVLSGGKSLNNFAKIAGLSAKDFAAAFAADPVDALNAFLAGLGSIKDAGEDVYAALDLVGLSDIRVTDTLLRMSNAQGTLTTNIGLANDAWTANNALTNEASKRYATTESKLKLAKNSIDNMMTSLGDMLLPAIADGADFVSNLAQGFNELDDSAKNLIGTGAAILAGAGPAMKLISGLIGLLTGPAGLVIGLALLGVGAVALINHLDSLARAQAWEELNTNLSGVKLTTEQLQAIIETKLTMPTPDLAALETAKATVQSASTEIDNNLSAFDTHMYNIHIGVDTTNAIASLPAALDSLIAASQLYLNQQSNTVSLALGGLFGDDPEGKELQAEFNTYFAGINGMAAAKGEEMRSALDNAIADGIIDDEEQKTIDKLRMELLEIIEQGSMIETEAGRRKMSMYASTSELSAESAAELAKMQSEWMDNAITASDAYRQTAIDSVYKLAAMDPDNWSDDKLFDAIKSIEDKHGQNVADIQLQNLDISSTYSQRVTDYFDGQIKALQEDAVKHANEQLEKLGLDKNSEFGQLTYAQEYQSYYYDKGSGLSYQAKELYDPMKEMIAAERQHAAVLGDEAPADLLARIEAYKLLETLATNYWTLMEKTPEVETPKVTVPNNELKNEIVEVTTRELTGAEQDIKNNLAALWDGVLSDIMLQGLNLNDSAGLQKFKDMMSEILLSMAPEGSDGNEFAQSILSIVNQLEVIPNSLSEMLEVGQADAATAGTDLVGAAIDGGANKAGDMGTVATQVSSGFTQEIARNYYNSRNAGQTYIEQFLIGARRAARIESPSKEAAGIANYVNEGYVDTVKSHYGDANKAGEGYINASTSGMETGLATLEKVEDTAAKRRAANAAANAKARAAAAKAAAEAQYAAELSAIITGGDAILAAEANTWQKRLAQYNAQNDAMMATIGKLSVWYEDTSLDKALADSSDYFGTAMDKAQADYEQQAAKLQSTIDTISKKDKQTDADKALKESEEAKLKALTEAHNERIAQLQAQSKEEAAILKDQYATQKDITLRWIDEQQSILRADTNAINEEARLQDYEHELAALQKQLRQSKSAREQRELQEEIDRMIRDEEIYQKEQENNALSDAWGELRSAVNAGLVGLGDLLQDPALPGVSYGSSGLDGITTIGKDAMAEILAALEASTIANPTGGSVYQIDLRGATVRSDNDIQAIVDEFEARMRSANR